MSLKTLTERFEEVNKIKNNNPKIDKAVFNIKDVGDLLDLYNKEMEANRILSEQNMMMSQRHLNDSAKLKNSISKDRVKEKLQELENKSGGNSYHVQSMINAEKNILEELLEEK